MKLTTKNFDKKTDKTSDFLSLCWWAEVEQLCILSIKIFFLKVQMSRANDKGHYFRFIILLQAHKWQYNNLESNKRLTLILSVVYEAELNIGKLSADAKNPTGLGLKRGRPLWLEKQAMCIAPKVPGSSTQ